MKRLRLVAGWNACSTGFAVLLAACAFGPIGAGGQTTVGLFTGGDPGEGLDLEGLFVQAVNVAPDADPNVGTIGNATFTKSNVVGVNLEWVNQIGVGGWGTAELGDSPNDNAMETILRSIRWSPAPQTVNLTLTDLEPGAEYKLQLLFYEACCANRAFDIVIDGELVVDEFNPSIEQGGVGAASGAVVTHEFVPAGNQIAIILDGNGITTPDFTDRNSILSGFTLEIMSDDTDGDGLLDVWEVQYFGDITSQDGTGDPDSDGLNNLGELGAGSKPTVVDTDGDGLSDGDEVNVHESNPILPDTDGDGLIDGDEVNVHMTDPTRVDSDDDGLSDRNEVAFGLSDPALPDTDGDGVGDLIEVAAQSDAMNGDVIPRGTVPSLFTGGDPGEGLDLEGTFVHAFNAGTNGIPGFIGDADFTDDFAPGILLTATQLADAWNPGAQFGDTINDDNLELLMQSIRWSDAPNAVDLELSGLVEGQRYKMQMLFAEACCPNRGFDVFVDGVMVQNDFSPALVAGGAGRGNLGVVLTHEFTAGSDSVAVRLGGSSAVVGIAVNGAPYSDLNAILQGLTLESVDVGPDTDGDGLPDAWEMEEFGDLSQTGDGDADSDGLSNAAEYRLSSNPNAADTDGDGLADGAEATVHGTNVVRADTDGDYLGDGAEINDWMTDPLGIDSDGDTLVDGVEVNRYLTDPAKADTDDDGFADNVELANATDPRDPASFPQGTLAFSFTGGDRGEGLDFEGSFLYAVNVGTNGAAGRVGDAEFTDDFAPGVLLTAQNEIAGWHAPDYGTTANDDNLEFVMQSIRWSAAPSTVQLTLENLIPGQQYKLQLLFAEQCCGNRAFDVKVGGELIFDEFNPSVIQGGAGNTSAGAAIVHVFTASGNSVAIELDGNGVTTPGWTDHNAIFSGFTLETVLPAEVFQILNLERSASEVSFEFTSIPGRIYAIEYKEKLTDPIWAELDDGVEATGTRTSFTDTDANRAQKPTGFYRVVRLN